MRAKDVQGAVIEVLQEIQSDSGFKERPIGGSTCPVKDLEGFDSPIWLDATGMISTKLGINIPLNHNIFVSHGKPLTIDESVAKICELIQGEKT